MKKESIFRDFLGVKTYQIVFVFVFLILFHCVYWGWDGHALPLPLIPALADWTQGSNLFVVRHDLRGRR